MTGKVYFVMSDATSHMKIGWTSRLEHRIAELQVSNPFPLRLVGSFPGTRFDEKDVHRKFWKNRVAGEWFLCNGDMLLEIEKMISERSSSGASLDPDEEYTTIRVTGRALRCIDDAIKELLSEMPPGSSARMSRSAAIDFFMSERIRSRGVDLIDKATPTHLRGSSTAIEHVMRERAAAQHKRATPPDDEPEEFCEKQARRAASGYSPEEAEEEIERRRRELDTDETP